MAKPKNEFESYRVRLDGYIQMRKPGVAKNEREQVLYEFCVEHSEDRKAFPMAKELLIAALNGELGPQLQKAVQAGDTEAALEAARDLISDFVIDI